MLVPIRRASLSDDIVVGDDMVAPSQRNTGRDTWACRLVGGSQNPHGRITAKPADTVNLLRVNTEAYPTNCAVVLAMLLTLAAICAEIVQGQNPWWIGWGSIVLAGGGFVPTMMRTVPNARRLGMAEDFGEGKSRLARAVCRDHMLSFARMTVVLGLQLIAR